MFHFIQMADTQFGFFDNDSSFAKETELFEQAIAQANLLQPDFVVISGDLLNKPGDEAQLAEFNRIADMLQPDIPLYPVAGNHDVGDIPTPASLALYREEFGPDRYAFEYKGWRFITINSCIIHDPDSVQEEREAQWTWLEEELNKTPVLPTIILMHHPLFLNDPEEPEGYFNISPAERAKYLTLFEEKGVQAIMAGHFHRNSLAQAGSMEMITTGPVGRPLGPDPSGFRIVTVFQSSIKHAYYGLDELAETIPPGEN